jgi:5-methylcytosine-specific restriction endonuclease McrA
MAIVRPCLDCGQLWRGSRCPACARAQDRRRGTTAERFGAGWATISRKVIERDGGVCQLSLPGCTVVATTADHIISRSQGGDSDPANLRAACRACNSRRGARAA